MRTQAYKTRHNSTILLLGSPWIQWQSKISFLCYSLPPPPRKFDHVHNVMASRYVHTKNICSTLESINILELNICFPKNPFYWNNFTIGIHFYLAQLQKLQRVDLPVYEHWSQIYGWFSPVFLTRGGLKTFTVWTPLSLKAQKETDRQYSRPNACKPGSCSSAVGKCFLTR